MSCYFISCHDCNDWMLSLVLAMMIRFSPQLQVSHWVQCNSHEEEIQFKFNHRKIYRSRLSIMKSWCEFRSFIDTNLFNSHYRPTTVTPESHYHKPWKTWLGLKTSATSLEQFEWGHLLDISIYWRGRAGGQSPASSASSVVWPRMVCRVKEVGSLL